MSQNAQAAVTVIGIDIGKNSFHIVGHNKHGAIVLRQKWSRGQVEARLANLPPCLIGMEACVGAHHLSRKLNGLSHDARLMPAKYVRPYSKGQKNDFRDAEAIAEAVQRPTMKFVATKTADQLDLQALHRVRERLVSQRTGIINQIRAFLLERGIAVRQGQRFLRAELPRILAAPTSTLSPRMSRVIEDLSGDWRRLDERIEQLSIEIATLAHADAGCERLCWGRLHQRPRLCRLVRARPTTDVHRRSDDPRQDIKARQSLPAGSVRAGRMGCFDQATELGQVWSQVLDRSRSEAATPQCAGDCACQQARAHRVECAGSRSSLRGEQVTDRVAATPHS